jgi:hypothetical protein
MSVRHYFQRGGGRPQHLAREAMNASAEGVEFVELPLSITLHWQ